MMEKRVITIQDLYRLNAVNDPQISPNGKQVAFSIQGMNQKKNCYHSHLYLADIESGEVRQFSHGAVNDQQPRWTPNGNFIAYRRTKNKVTQIWQIPISGGEAQQLTNLEQGRIGAFTWSPDGQRIALEFRPTHPDWTKESYQQRKKKNLSNPPRVIEQLHYRQDGVGFLDTRQQIWIWEVESGNVKPVTEGGWDCRDPVWSPDGKFIAFISNRCEDPDNRPYEENIWLVPTAGGELQKIGTPDGYKSGLSWSPDGKHLAYIGSETREDPWGGRNNRIWITSLEGNSTRCQTVNLDRIAENANVADLRGTGNQTPIWQPDSGGLYFVVSDRGNCHLYSVAPEEEPEIVVGGEIDITGFSLDAEGKRLAILASKPDLPTEIFTLSLDANSDRPTPHLLTKANKQLLNEFVLSQPEEIWFSSFDETEIQGWLLKPPIFDPHKRYPLVLYIHGGPAAQYANTFFHEYQVLAAQEYVVLYTNPRGSLGREETFATCIRGNWGNLDYKDLMAAMDHAETLPYIDKNRMAIIGGSYGGFMVTWIAGHTNRFCCGITERGVSNRHSAVGTTDHPPMPDGYWPGNTWDQPERLWQQSPLRVAENIETPLLIIHSEGDLRCPIGQAEQLFAALKRLGREVTFLRYPAETSHGLSRNGPPDLRIDRLERITVWLERYLK